MALTIQELADVSGISVATIKFYVREGLLAAPVPGVPLRKYYDASHVRRLATIRALRDVGKLSIDVIRRALAAIDEPGDDAVDVIGPAIDALAPDPAVEDEVLVQAREDVRKAFGKLRVRAEAGSRETVAQTLAALRRVGSPIDVAALEQYIAWMTPLARNEIEREPTRTILLSDKETSLEIAVLGTVMWEPLLIGLRRALHEHFVTGLTRKKRR